MANNFNILIKGILELSNHKLDYKIAFAEWDIEALIMNRSNPKRCLCSKFPIIEQCHLRNTLNNNVTIVGNCCMKKFNGGYDWYFSQIKRIKEDKLPNKKFTDFLLGNFLISSTEHNEIIFLFNKRKFTFEMGERKLELIKRIQRIVKNKLENETNNNSN